MMRNPGVRGGRVMLSVLRKNQPAPWARRCRIHRDRFWGAAFAHALLVHAAWGPSRSGVATTYLCDESQNNVISCRQLLRQCILNSNVSQPNSGTYAFCHQDGQELYQRGLAVIASHALNSHCSRRLCARRARNRLIIVASSSSTARRTSAS